jgi:Cutinase
MHGYADGGWLARGLGGEPSWRRVFSLGTVLSALVLAGAVLPCASQAAGGTIATSAFVTIGQIEHGDSGTTPYEYSPGSCGPETGQYWRLTLLAGDRIEIQWGSTSNYVTGLDIWPAGTSDATIAVGGRASWDSIGPHGNEETTFTATTSGTYVLVFDDSCGQAGPYEFTVSLLAGSAPPISSVPSTGCPGYMVIDSRGSGESAGTASPPGAAFAHEFRRLHPTQRVAVLKNPYPAVGLWGSWREILNLIGAGLGIGRIGAYHDSVVEGKRWLREHLASETTICPRTKLLLSGYSQGAQVAADVYQRSVSAAERSHILAVVLFGDPYFNVSDAASDRGTFARHGRSGVLGRRPTFGGDRRVLSYCHLHDPVCQHPTVIGLARYKLKQHENYTRDGSRAAHRF